MDGCCIKDINIFGNIAKNAVVQVDDQLISFVNSLDNGILITQFTGNKNDSELLNWLEILLKALEFTDISKYLHDVLMLRQHLLYLVQQ